MPTASVSKPFWTPWVIAAALGVAVLVVVANVHLVSVSFGSQPGCVPYQKASGEGAAGLRAANPSC